jgi:hypothetical protein
MIACATRFAAIDRDIPFERVAFDAPTPRYPAQFTRGRSPSRISGASKAKAGPNAARSQDFLYADDGLPE